MYLILGCFVQFKSSLNQKIIYRYHHSPVERYDVYFAKSYSNHPTPLTHCDHIPFPFSQTPPQ